MKKVIIFIVAIVLLFVGIYVIQTNANKKASQGNPYGKETLNPETVKLLNKPEYKNIIKPDDLAKKIESGESVTAYFFSPLCETCMQTTPIMKPVADKHGVEVYMMNLLEFDDQWQRFGIEQTPTLVTYKDGKEVTRVLGNIGADGFDNFFTQWVK